MTFHIITIFPEIFNSYFAESIIKRALEKDKIKINIINLRDYTKDKHKTTDDSPFGGGAGMVMKIEPLYRALRDLRSESVDHRSKIHDPRSTIQDQRSKTILTSAKGKTWNQKLAQDYSKLNDVTIICGRYEGVDERITDYIDEEISIGDYVLTGGELGAMTMVDSITRLLPDVLGNQTSAIDESHSEEGVLEYPQYTRPEIFVDDEGKKLKVPEILLSGHHKNIVEWQKKMKKNKNK